jgi:hypothetical protein
MKRSSRLGGFASTAVILLAGSSVRAAPPTAEVMVDARIGQSTAPYSTAAFPETSGYGAVLIGAARYRKAERWQLGLRVPLVLMRIEQPAGALYAEAAWANPELSVALERPWLELDGWRLSLQTSLAVGVPLAQHDSAQLAGRALRLANALEGFSEPGLYTPGVLPLTPAGRVGLQSPRWKVAASLALPLLFRVSNADLPAESEPRSFALTPIIGLDARLRVLRWLWVGIAPRLTVQAVPPVEDHAAPLQLLAAGHVDANLGEHLSVSALLQAPIAGPLGGSTISSGLRLGLAF